MKGDFSRDTFRPFKHYSRVLLQQGRVQLDADWNEQVSILLHHLRTLTADLIGPHAGPAGKHYGFQISRKGSSLVIGRGRYYVGGILCENEADLLPPHLLPPQNPELLPKQDDDVTYLTQPDWHPKPLTQGTYFLYLDVWERYVTALEDESLREVALGGPDTAGRAKIVWQVKAKPIQANLTPYGTTEWEQFLGDLERPFRGRMKAVAKKEDTLVDEPCTIHPDARYRGENQLWRVEVHRGGQLGQGDAPTFKVSFDNGSVVFPVIEASTSTKNDAVTVSFTVKDLGRDARTTLNEGDWVELVDDRYALQCGGGPNGEWNPDPLLLVTEVDRESFIVTAQTIRVPGPLGTPAAERGTMLLRRWDHRAFDAEPRKDGDGYGTFAMTEDPIKLPDGIEIAFEATALKQTPHVYRSGDYWLIPAREATGDVEWDGDYQLPRGIVHHYAPLAIVRVVDAQLQSEITDLRASFTAPSSPYPYEGEGIGIDEL